MTVLSLKYEFSNYYISLFKTGRKSQQIQTDGDDNDNVSINQVIENRVTPLIMHL